MQNKNSGEDLILSFILLNYNNADYTVKCINSINETVTVPNEIIVVDNASADDSLEQLSQFKEIKLIKNSTNRGFTGANNDGVKVAEGKYVVILNNDTTIYDSNMNQLPAILDRHEKYDVVGGRIIGEDGQPQACGGYEPVPFHFIMQFTVFCYKKFSLPWLKDFWFFEWDKDQIKEADWAGGCFFAMRRDTYLEMGGFDEKIFIYLDDVEFHKRLRSKGGRVCLYPELLILHYGQISWKGSNHYVGLKHNYDSAAYIIGKNHGLFYKFVFIFLVKAVNLFLLPFFAILYLFAPGDKAKIRNKLKFCTTLLLA